MKCVISHATALQWLMGHPNREADVTRSSRVSLAGASAPVKAQEQLVRNDLWLAGDAPIDVLVPSSGDRRNTPGIRCHVCSLDLPRGSLVAVPSARPDFELYVCAPELVFLQMAYQSDVLDAIYYGMALCSEYRIDPSARGGVTLRQYGDEPLATAARISEFLGRVAGAPGHARAERALAHVIDRARSPRESALAMLFGLPVRLGGFNLGAVTLNENLEIFDGRDAQGNVHSHLRCPDITIRNVDRAGRKRVVLVDYDAVSVHADPGSMARDARRRNEIASVPGRAHITITTEQANDFDYMEQLADRMRRMLGRRKQPLLKGNSDSAANRIRLMRARQAQYELWERFVMGHPGV